MSAFGTRLRAAMDNRGPLCVGIDPHPGLLAAWGLSDDASGLETFASVCVDALASDVAVLKPQSAFFERHGSTGIAVLERLIGLARERGALVLLDVKRGDIGSTMQGYAEAYLDPAAPLAVDAITVTPFLGFESLRPAFDVAATHGAGVFVVTRTSNPQGAQVQLARGNGDGGGGDSVAAQLLFAIGVENAGATPLGSVGAVVAANLDSAEGDLAVNGPLLAPGFGAQGGTVAHLRRLFAPVRHLVLPSTSRQVLEQGPDPGRLRRSALEAIDDIAGFVAG